MKKLFYALLGLGLSCCAISATSLAGDLPPSEATIRFAVYDIADHVVYMPDGTVLEAHSGAGPRVDDPSQVSVKDRGPTPPNLYALTLRENVFHGVWAIRLTPVGDGKMFGRIGLLAHSYMLHSEGQSNGCVVFKNYETFLQAFLSGEVDYLLVVPYIDNVTLIY